MQQPSPPFAGMLAAALAVSSCAAHAAVPVAGADRSPLTAALFAEVPAAALPPGDRLAIAALVPLTLRSDVIVSSRPGCGDAPMDPQVRLDDLNGDRAPEVFVLAGNTCTSGMTGVSVWLYAKQRDGRWRQLLDVAAAAYRILPSMTYGWHDLALLGRGRCAGVWRLGPDGQYGYAHSIAPDGSPCPQGVSR